MKRTLSLVLALVMLLGTIPVFAAEVDERIAFLEAEGLLKGNTAGDLMLENELKRQDSVVVLARLLGLEEAALAYEGEFPWEDAKADPFYFGFLAWAYEEGLYKGHSDEKFGFNETITANDFALVLLRALGYEDPAVWSEAFDKAEELGLVEGLDLEGTDKLLRSNMAIMMYLALGTEMAEGGKTLAEVLEVVMPEVGLTAEASVTGAREFTVEFNDSVEGATFAVRRGTVNINIQSTVWNETKTVATITAVSKLLAGTYSLTVVGTDLEDPVLEVVVEAEKAASIEILNDVAPIALNADGTMKTNEVRFNYSVKNQYGEEYTSAAITWNSSMGPVDDVTAGVKAIVLTSGNFVIDQQFVVTALEASSGLFASKTLKVGAPARVSVINSLTLNNTVNKELTTGSTFGDYFVKVDALDQYGNKVTASQITSDLLVNVSNPSVFGLENSYTGTSGWKLTKPVNNIAGTATVTVISKYTGQSASLAVTVGAQAALDTLLLQVPTDTVVAGESVVIPFTAFDQFGVELSESAKAGLNSNILTVTGVGITFDFAMNYKTGKAELTMNVAADAATGSRIIMAVTPTGKVSQINVVVRAAAYPVAVSATKDLVTNLTVDAISKLDVDNLVIVDNYTRVMKASDFPTGYRLVVSAADDITKVGLSGTMTGDIDVTFKGVAAGSRLITVAIQKEVDSVWTTVNNSGFDFNVTTVAKSAIAEYVVEVPELLFNATTHAKALNVYGKLSNGAKVALAVADFSVTTNDEAVSYVNGKLQASGVTFPLNTTEVVKTVIVVLQTATGPQTVTKNVTITNVQPKLTTLAADAVEYLKIAELTAADIKAQFIGKDQYGVVIPYTTTNIVVTQIESLAGAVAFNGQAAPTFAGFVAGDSFNVTIVTEDGMTASTKIVVMPNSN